LDPSDVLYSIDGLLLHQSQGLLTGRGIAIATITTTITAAMAISALGAFPEAFFFGTPAFLPLVTPSTGAPQFGQNLPSSTGVPQFPQKTIVSPF